MILPDINLLVYAYNSDAPRHARARAWWETCLSEPQPVAMAWVVMLGFVRLMTSRTVLNKPLPRDEAIGHVRAWLERPQVEILNPGKRHLDLVQVLAAEAGAAGALTTDIHLAALAVEMRAELHSNDKDFVRFSGLRWLDPLA